MRERGRNNQDAERADPGHGVGARDTEENPAQHGGHRCRERDSGEAADGDERGALLKDQSKDLRPIRPQRESNADLTRPSADGEGNDAVQPDRREDRAEHANVSQFSNM